MSWFPNHGTVGTFETDDVFTFRVNISYMLYINSLVESSREGREVKGGEVIRKGPGGKQKVQEVGPAGQCGQRQLRAQMGHSTHQNHLRAVGAEHFMGPGLARLRGAVPLAVQLQANSVMSHGVEQLGHLTRLQVVKVDGGTHNLVP
jgi:hypothetical protein